MYLQEILMFLFQKWKKYPLAVLEVEFYLTGLKSFSGQGEKCFIMVFGFIKENEYSLLIHNLLLMNVMYLRLGL